MSMGKDTQGPREGKSENGRKDPWSHGGCDGQQNPARPAKPRSQSREEPTDPLLGLVTTELKS